MGAIKINKKFVIMTLLVAVFVYLWCKSYKGRKYFFYVWEISDKVHSQVQHQQPKIANEDLSESITVTAE